MALKKTVVTPQGFDATDAYHRVEQVSLISKTEIQFAVVSYKDASTKSRFVFDMKTGPYDIDSDNPIKQAYDHLKTLPEFSGAEDC